MPNFRHLLFLALLFLPLASWSQTTEEEFNYANGGYLKLQELGYGTKPNYQLVEAPVGIAPGQEGPVTVLALVREANEKTAAAILTTTDQNGQTQVRWVICEPRSVWSLEKKSFENQTLFPKSTDSSTLAFTYRMFQKALWPDRSEGAENRVTNYTNDRIEEAQITDFEVPKSSFYLPGRNNIELPLPSDDCKSEGTVVVKIFVIPIITTLVGERPNSRVACHIWPMISPVVRLRLKPCCAVEQNEQSKAQPTCDDTQIVLRSPSGICTVSIR